MGHTWYKMKCSLKATGSEACEWEVERRLLHVRQFLHDPVKLSLGGRYSEHFAHACFASHGGIPGTTSLLRDWHRALATCINKGFAQPTLVALVHRFLETPEVVSIADGSHEQPPLEAEPHETALEPRPEAIGADAELRADIV